MTTEIEKSNIIAEILKSKDIKKLLSVLTDSTPPTKKQTRQERIQKWMGRKDKFDPSRLAQLRKTMSSFVTKLFAEVDITEPRELTSDEAYSLMLEYLSIREIQDALEARKTRMKEMVLASVSETAEKEGKEDPENINGSIEVEKLGKKFCKEGTGKTEPTINLEILRSVLPKRAWASIIDKTIIPRSIVEEINETKLALYLQAHPEKMEDLRKAIIPGENKTPRFTVRDI